MIATAEKVCRRPRGVDISFASTNFKFKGSCVFRDVLRYFRLVIFTKELVIMRKIIAICSGNYFASCFYKTQKNKMYD